MWRQTCHLSLIILSPFHVTCNRHQATQPPPTLHFIFFAATDNFITSSSHNAMATNLHCYKHSTRVYFSPRFPYTSPFKMSKYTLTDSVKSINYIAFRPDCFYVTYKICGMTPIVINKTICGSRVIRIATKSYYLCFRGIQQCKEL